MVAVLPIATIKRILDRVTSLPGQASEFVPGTDSPTQTTKPLPKLPENIVSALEKSRDDKTLIDGGKHVGPLRRDDFTTLRDWCRAMRLGSDAAAVEAAVTAAPK
jgi:hypothetical protein